MYVMKMTLKICEDMSFSLFSLAGTHPHLTSTSIYEASCQLKIEN